jgi:L-threonylcarbamoyladenylate synthase
VDDRLQDTPVPNVPGQHHVHYAPRTKTQVIKTEKLAAFLQALPQEELPVVCVVYTQTSYPHIDHVQWVNMPAEAAAYAHDIYRTLRALDTEHYKQIIIEEVPERAEWNAIQDRLLKAAGER